MTILNFVTQDELDNLNEDPRMAFMELVNHAQRSLSEQTKNFDPENQYEWNKKTDLEKAFMNVIVAAGKNFEIEPFSTMVIPRQQNFRNEDYEQFKSDLDHFITQLILSNSSRAKGLSVKILPQSKERITSYVVALRDCVETANMQPSVRRALLGKLSEFEKEMDKPRVSFVALSMVAIAIIGAPGATWGSVDVVHKLMNNITQAFAESKQAEDATRRIAPDATPKALSPPRPPEPKRINRPWEPGPSGDLDDDIPF